MTYWLCSLPLWFVIALPAFLGLGMGMLAFVHVARIVAEDLTTFLEMIF